MAYILRDMLCTGCIPSYSHPATMYAASGRVLTITRSLICSKTSAGYQALYIRKN